MKALYISAGEGRTLVEKMVDMWCTSRASFKFWRFDFSIYRAFWRSLLRVLCHWRRCAANWQKKNIHTISNRWKMRWGSNFMILDGHVVNYADVLLVKQSRLGTILPPRNAWMSLLTSGWSEQQIKSTPERRLLYFWVIFGSLVNNDYAGYISWRQQGSGKALKGSER